SEDDQRGDQAIPAGERGPESDLKRVQRDCENQRPDHEIEEWGKDPEAEDGENRDKPGTNQNVEQLAGVWALGILRKHHVPPRSLPRGDPGGRHRWPGITVSEVGLPAAVMRAPREFRKSNVTWMDLT